MISKGARYKFGVSVQSKGFAEAPAAILKALKRLDWAKNVAVSSATANFPADHEIGDDSITNLDAHSQSFNELLALGYMEDDKINVCYRCWRRYCSVLTYHSTVS